MSNPNTRKSCVVPKCKSTTINAPEKLFFMVPMDVEMRKKWIKAMRRLDPFGAKSTVYCCEDHFDIENDMENYVKYKLVGGKIKLKKGIVPHKFKCQKENNDKPKRSAVQKRNQIKKIEKLLSKDEEPMSSKLNAPESPETILVACCKDENVIEDPLSSENNDQYLEISKEHKAVQVKLKNKVVHKSTLTEEKYLKKDRITTSHIKGDTTSVCSMTDIFSETPTDEMNSPDQDSNTSDMDNLECEKRFLRNYMQKPVPLCISREPQLLLGLPKECNILINILCETTKCIPRNIMITLKKIRLHQSNASLVKDFGLATSSVTKIFRRTVPAIASALKSFVFFPPSADIQLNLPIPFRKNYTQVQIIIDCFEIQIEKPVDAVKQALTWSDYKSCNTIKYLISTTPDGLISFVSPGYGGRTADFLIFEDCGIFQALPEGAAVLADRGFKNIAHLLQQNGNTLIRPPSVSAQEKEVLDTKKNSALRIHAEKAIGRLRGFGYILPHACVDLKEVDLLDSVVISACGIVNLQNTLFNLE